MKSLVIQLRVKRLFLNLISVTGHPHMLKVLMCVWSMHRVRMSRRMRIIINFIFNSIFLYIYLHCSVYFSVILMRSLGLPNNFGLWLSVSTLDIINLYFKNILYNFEFDRFMFPETCTGCIVYDNTAVRFSRDVIFTDAGFQSMMTLLLT